MKHPNHNKLEQMRQGSVICGGKVLSVYIAASTTEKNNGLCRISKEELGDRGMLFLLGPLDECFVMDNVLMPLDIAFLSPDGLIISIHLMPTGMLRYVPVPNKAAFALEANVGMFGRFGIVRDAKAEIIIAADPM